MRIFFKVECSVRTRRHVEFIISLLTYNREHQWNRIHDIVVQAQQQRKGEKSMCIVVSSTIFLFIGWQLFPSRELSLSGSNGFEFLNSQPWCSRTAICPQMFIFRSIHHPLVYSLNGPIHPCSMMITPKDLPTDWQHFHISLHHLLDIICCLDLCTAHSYLPCLWKLCPQHHIPSLLRTDERPP